MRIFQERLLLRTRTTMTPTVLLTNSSLQQKARRLREGWNEWGEWERQQRESSLCCSRMMVHEQLHSLLFPQWQHFDQCQVIKDEWSHAKKKIMEKNHFLDFKNLVADAKSSMSGWGYNSVQGLLLSRHKSLGLILWTEKKQKMTRELTTL